MLFNGNKSTHTPRGVDVQMRGCITVRSCFALLVAVCVAVCVVVRDAVRGAVRGAVSCGVLRCVALRYASAALRVCLVRE